MVWGVRRLKNTSARLEPAQLSNVDWAGLKEHSARDSEAARALIMTHDATSAMWSRGLAKLEVGLK